MQSRVEKIWKSETPRVSVVIPHFYESRRKNLDGLIQDIRSQTFKEVEVIVVHRVSPQGKAINEGARQALGEILVVMDDDSRMGDSNTIENLVRTLTQDLRIAMCGASIIPPENANWFQKIAARQFPRFQMPIVSEATDSDLACHGCVAFRSNVFVRVGMEREDILRGLDPDLRVRFREAGYRVVLAANTWAYHPLPDSISKFIRLFFRNGYGSAHLQVVHPEMSYDTDESVGGESFIPKRSLLYRMFRYPLRLVHAAVTLQWVRFLGYAVYSVGYVAGFLRFAILKGRS